MISTIALCFLLANFVHPSVATGSGMTSSLDATTPQPTATTSAGVLTSASGSMLHSSQFLPAAIPGTSLIIKATTITGTMSTISTDLIVSEGTTSESPTSDDGSGMSTESDIFLGPSTTPSAETTNSVPSTTTEFSETTSDQPTPSETESTTTEPTQNPPDHSKPTPAGNGGLVAGIAVASVTLLVLIIILCALVCCFHMHK